jgi:glycerol-3-phosphate dehydrogenase
MGEDMINKIESHFGWNKTKSITNKLKVHGWEENNDAGDPLAVYGNEAKPIKSIMESEAGEWISKSLNIHSAQVKWAVMHEMARTVEDVLARRTRALLLDAKESLRIAPLVATCMASLMKKDQQWIDQQLKDYSSLAKNYILLKQSQPKPD